MATPTEIAMRLIFRRSSVALLVFSALLAASSVHAQPANSGPPINRLTESVKLTMNSINAKWGIYVKQLTTGEEIAINADVEMETMSTIKISLMIEVLSQVKAGKMKLTDKYTLAKADMQGGSGTLQFMDPGAVMTLKDLLTYMTVVSDNTATEVLYKMVGGIPVVNARMKSMGFTHTRAVTTPSILFAAARKLKSDQYGPALHDKRLEFGVTTPREMGKILEMIERKTMIDKASSELILQIMRNQVYASRLPKFIPYSYEVPHKTGDFPPFVANDVGIIELPNAPVVMSVYANEHTGRYDVLENAIALIAQDVMNYFVYRAK